MVGKGCVLDGTASRSSHSSFEIQRMSWTRSPLGASHRPRHNSTRRKWYDRCASVSCPGTGTGVQPGGGPGPGAGGNLGGSPCDLAARTATTDGDPSPAGRGPPGPKCCRRVRCLGTNLGTWAYLDGRGRCRDYGPHALRMPRGAPAAGGWKRGAAGRRPRLIPSLGAASARLRKSPSRDSFCTCRWTALSPVRRAAKQSGRTPPAGAISHF
jgi:hypothetical protein